MRGFIEKIIMKVVLGQVTTSMYCKSNGAIEIFKKNMYGKEVSLERLTTCQANRADGLCKYCKGLPHPPAQLA